MDRSAVAGRWSAPLRDAGSSIAQERTAADIEYEAALRVAPDDERVHRVRAAIHQTYARAQSSSMGRNLLAHAALASERWKRDLAESG